MNDPKDQAAYSAIYNSIDKIVVDHIPKKLPNNQIGFSFFSPENNGFGQLCLLTKFSSKEEFLKIKTELSHNIIFSGHENDKCFAVIDGIKHGLVPTSNLDNCKEIFPIPNESISYWDEFSASNQNPIKKKYENVEVIIKERRIGDFLTIIHSNETAKNKSGYSKGYTFIPQDLIIIYWTMYW